MIGIAGYCARTYTKAENQMHLVDLNRVKLNQAQNHVPTFHRTHQHPQFPESVLEGML